MKEEFMKRAIWLKPILKSLNKIVECGKSKLISYKDIKKGNIILLKSKNSERTYIATSNWESNTTTANFLNLSGSYVTINEHILRKLKVSSAGCIAI